MSTEMFSLDGDRVLVTGAGRGLGRAVARGMADAGARVALLSRTTAQVEQAAAEIGGAAVAVGGDVVEEEPGALVDRVERALGGPVDSVVHAAGIQHRQPAAEFDREAWNRVLQVNLTAPFLLSQEIGRRQLEAERSGSHLFIGSLTSTLSIQEVTAYTASKSGVVGVMRNLSTEWSGRGIRANAVAPGYFRTEMTEELFNNPVRYRQMLDRIPMGRFGQPEELVGAAVFFSSPAASYVTGQLLMVDGGWTAR